MDLESVADELYACAPGDFTPTRTEREKQAKAAGDRELAAAIRGLRKPTLTAWVCNLLARERPDSLAPLKELGEHLRAAQQALQGDELRALGRQRQQLVHALVTEARQVAAGHGQKLTESVVRELEQTLEATLADPTVADTVAAGQLTTAVQHAGFGTGGVLAGPARSAARREPPARRSTAVRATSGETPDEVALRRRANARSNAERDVLDAEQALSTAESSLDTASDASAEVERAQTTLTERIATLEAELTAAEENLPAVRRQARQAERDRDKAEQVRNRAQRMLTKAQAALADLD